MTRPNIVFVIADDHAVKALSAYGSELNTTPNLDRIAAGGMRFDNTFCTNALCAPSRASILTGTYSHVNGVTTIHTPMDNRRPTFPGRLHDSGYQTALVGKWHLGHGADHDPRGFDYWDILDDQGLYHDPVMVANGRRQTRTGYVTDVLTDLALSWLAARDRSRPFCLIVPHKAPHRPFEVDDRHAGMYADAHFPEPETLRDDYSGRAAAARNAQMRIADHLSPIDLKVDPPPGLGGDELLSWRYQRYLQDYLGCVAAMDDSVGRLLDYLDSEGIADDTIVVYTSDHGFFLGEHGWFDKRFMYEESMRIPLLVRYPRLVRPGSACDAMVTNVDLAQTMLELTGTPPLPDAQGRSLVPLLRGEQPPDWRTSIYYRYWMNDDPVHASVAHYGVRTERHKLIHYYGDGLGLAGTGGRRFEPEWELFDLERDPHELRSVYDDPDYADVRRELETELDRLQRELGDRPYAPRGGEVEASPACSPREHRGDRGSRDRSTLDIPRRVP